MTCLVDIDHQFDVVVIGGGIAGIAAASMVRVKSPKTTIAVIADDVKKYSNPSIVSIVRGSAESSQIAADSSEYLSHLDIRFFGGYQARSIFPRDKIIDILNSRHESKRLVYEKSIICTGSNPTQLSVPGAEKSGVVNSKRLADAQLILKCLRTSSKCSVIGSGLIGLEFAEAARRRGCDVTVIARGNILGSVLEPELAEVVAKRMSGAGIRLLRNSKISEIGGKNKVEYVDLDDQRIPTDLVISAVGFKPNSELAEHARIRIGQSGGIITGDKMESSAKDVYAAGDCIEVKDLVSDKQVYRPIGSVALKSAKVAGESCVGLQASFGGSLRSQFDRLFGIEITSIGLTSREADRLKMNIDVIDVQTGCAGPQTFPIRPKNSRIKVLIKRGTNSIVGCQMIGGKTSHWPSFFVTELIRRKKSIDSISQIGLSIR